MSARKARKMKVYDYALKEYIGFLGCDPERQQNAYVTQEFAKAYDYNVVLLGGGLWRLDQDTEGEDRSLSYYGTTTREMACYADEAKTSDICWWDPNAWEKQPSNLNATDGVKFVDTAEFKSMYHKITLTFLPKGAISY